MHNFARVAQFSLISMSLLILANLQATACADETVNASAAAEDSLQIAEDIGRWLISHSREEEHGLSWPDDVLSPETTGYDLGSGSAGKVLYFVALYNATGKSQYLQYAEQGGEYLIGLLKDPSNFEGNRRRASLYSGISGMGVALMNLHKVSKHQKYGDAVDQVINLLEKWSVRDSSGLHWSDEFNDLIFGEAGTVLFLSYVADRTGHAKALEMATAGANFLLGQAQPAESGSYWYFRRGRDFNLPNFSHGTAGVGYVLASAAAVSGEDEFSRGANDAFSYLRSIAEIDDSNFRIPYGWGSESWNGLYEFGWAHGLVGSSLFLQRLIEKQVSADLASEMLSALKHSIANINLPGTPRDPFAEPSTPLDMRFGRAGVLSVVSEWSRSDNSVSEMRDAIWTHIEDAAIRNEHGVYWEVDAPEFMGGGRAAYTGYFHGAAGIGLAILKLHAAISGRDPYVVMPDDPYSWAPQ